MRPVGHSTTILAYLLKRPSTIRSSKNMSNRTQKDEILVVNLVDLLEGVPPGRATSILFETLCMRGWTMGQIEKSGEMLARKAWMKRREMEA